MKDNMANVSRAKGQGEVGIVWRHVKDLGLCHQDAFEGVRLWKQHLSVACKIKEGQVTLGSLTFLLWVRNMTGETISPAR